MAKKLSRIGLYFNTIRYMKPKQIYYRLRKWAGLRCCLGCRVTRMYTSVHPIQTVPELDFDPVFLSRFSVCEWMEDLVTILHISEHMDWNRSWRCETQSPLWNFNLHYFEYLFPIWRMYEQTQDVIYIQKIITIMESWIDQNPQESGGDGWSPYTIDLRLTNWLSFYSYAQSDLPDLFRQRLIQSIHQQYQYLSEHLEKDLLGNHYFEDLKTLILCSIFFQDEAVLRRVIRIFLCECREEILKDGMHFELSPMYHNLILESMIKVVAALEEYGYRIPELTDYLQPMLDVAWSLCNELDRIPLFNDSGDNVAKSLSALVKASKVHFKLEPVLKNQFPAAGYYIFQKGAWKLLVDAGDPGPCYIPGHGHCDAMSFELYRDGKPVITNCGTYAYQTQQRAFFRSTAAHNTVQVNDVEQSQCWGVFRMAKRSVVRVVYVDQNKLILEMRDQLGQMVQRTIEFDQALTVIDETKDGTLTGYLHLLAPLQVFYECKSKVVQKQLYAPEYGISETIDAIVYSGQGRIGIQIPLLEYSEENYEGRDFVCGTCCPTRGARNQE